MRPFDPVRREKILQAIFIIAGKHGLTGININAISKEAGISIGSFYTYFTSKEEVIQAAYSSVEHKITSIIYKGFDASLPMEKSLKQIFLNTLEYRLRHYNETVFIDQYIQSKYVQLNFAKQVKQFEEQNKTLYDLIKKGQDEGIIAPIDVFTLISFINGSIRSLLNGIIQKLMPSKKEHIDTCFLMVWKAITI